MKKIFSLVLVLCMACTLTVAASAVNIVDSPARVADTAPTDTSGVTIKNGDDPTYASDTDYTEFVEQNNEMVTVYVLEVTAPITHTQGEPLTVVFSVPGVTRNTDVRVMHQKDDGSWEKITCVAGKDTVTATFDSFSPVVILVGKTASRPGGSTDSGDVVLSEKTGDMPLEAVLLCAVLLCAGAAVYAGKRRTA